MDRRERLDRYLAEARIKFKRREEGVARHEKRRGPPYVFPDGHRSPEHDECEDAWSVLADRFIALVGAVDGKTLLNCVRLCDVERGFIAFKSVDESGIAGDREYKIPTFVVKGVVRAVGLSGF